MSPPRRGAPEAIEFGGLAADRYHSVGEPDGPPIVIVHGAMDRAAGFRRTTKHLPDRDIIAYDRRGYGDSRHLPVATSITDHVDDLDRVCELFGAYGAPPLVVGHSVGGLIAMLALARPGAAGRMTGAVVYEAPLPWNDWYSSRGDDLVGLAPGDAAERFMRSAIGDRLWDRMPAPARADRCAEGPALLADLSGARSDAARVPFDLIDLPVVVGCGSESGEHHRRSAREAAQGIAGARFVEIDGSDHGIHLYQPTAFAALIGSWEPRR